MIVGVDYSTKALHLVRRADGTAEAVCRTVRLPSAMHLAERDAVLAREAGRILLADPGWWDDVWLAGVEYPFTNARFIGAIVLKTMLGAIVAAIPEHVHVIPLPARLWTPRFLRVDPDGPLPKVPMKGELRKPLIKQRAVDLGIPAGYEQDTYDAFGISWAVEEINRPALEAA